MHNRSHVWRASGGRHIRVSDMTAEHLCNTLNYIERGEHPPRDHAERQEDYYQLRQEAEYRLLDYRKYAQLAPLWNKELRNVEGRWFLVRRAEHTDPQVALYAEEFRGKNVRAVIKPHLGVTVQMKDDGVHIEGCVEDLVILNSSRPEAALGISPQPNKKSTRLYQLAPGDKFYPAGSPGLVYMKAQLSSDILKCVTEKHWQVIDGAFVRAYGTSDECYYPAVNMRNGKTYFLSGKAEVELVRD